MNTLNRGLLALLGLVMLTVGTMGTLTLLDALDAEELADAIPYRDVWEDWERIDWTRDWVRWVLLGGAIVVALSALIGLLRELSVSRGAGDRRVLERKPGGSTTIRLSALRRACEREAGAIAGVERVRVADIGIDGRAPRARYLVRADETAHLPTLGVQVAERAAASLGRMLAQTPEDVTVVMEVRHDRRAATRNRRVS